MKYLKDLISIVGKNKVKNIEIIGNELSKDQKLYKLYDGILQQKFSSDTHACKELYGTNDLNKGYRNIKSRLEKRAINTLFFIDQNASSYTDLQKANLSCYKNLAAIKIMAEHGARKASIKLSEKTLKIALKFEIHDIAINLLKDLRTYYGTLLGDQKRLKRYNHIFKHLKEDRDYEELAREMYDNLASNFVQSKTIKPFHIKIAKTYAKELEPLLEKSTYRQFRLFAHTVLVLRFQMENDHIGTINACNQALHFFQNQPHQSKTQIFNFIFKRLSSYTQIKEYEAADLDAKYCLTLVSEGSVNWFIVSQFYILLLFHSKKIQEAFSFYRKVRFIRKKKKSNLEIGKEFWNIIEAFIDYFIRIGEIEIPINKRKPRFDSRSFVKSLPAFSRDKRGMNIMILVLQILFLFGEKKEDEVNERMEALRNYTSRYLRKNDDFRSNCFIKMFLKIPESNYNRIALERNTKDLFKKLKTKPLEVASKPIEMEIIPFEMLWKMVLESLDRKLMRDRKGARLF